MKNRWIALIAMPLLAAACARGGEGDADAALVDTANSATILGDTTANAISPMNSSNADTTVAPAPVAEPAAPADSTAAQPADEHAAHGDSAAH
jgi:hypothetical protein